MNNLDHIFRELRNHYLMRIRDPESEIEKIRNQHPEWKKVGSEIWDKHPGSATLLFCVFDFQVVFWFRIQVSWIRSVITCTDPNTSINKQIN